MSDGAQPYRARPSLYRLPGERVPAWRCVCPGRKPWQRHQEPWLCTPEDVVRRYQQEHEITLVGVARMLHWLHQTFTRAA